MSHLTSQPIDPAVLAERVAAADRGAVVTFRGLVRNHHAGRDVVSLGYTAYGEMADRLCGEIIRAAEARWDVRAAVLHRLGELAIGEVAVAVAVAAPHRDVAFDACRWIIDELKARVPIWKHERYADGSSAWVDPTAPDGIVASPT